MSQFDSLARLEDRGPLRVMFVLTSMPVGGAETLLKNLIGKLDPERFDPEICCLKELGPVGEELAERFPATSNVLGHKYDPRIVVKLAKLLRDRKIDALITVGCGDKMFWGRLAAKLAKTPVVASALHSTGWPDGVGFLNRLLTPITDAFIAVASEHGLHLVRNEKFPAHKVKVIPNGVDTGVFRHDAEGAARIRAEFGIDEDAPVCGIVAALRPEKNHELFLNAAKSILERCNQARFLIVGDGDERPRLEKLANTLGIDQSVHFLGTRNDTVQILSATDVFCLTSHNEANPVSILEALSVGTPVVATRVGSVPLTVKPDVTGYLSEPGNVEDVSELVLKLLNNRELAQAFGTNGRQEVVTNWSLDGMVRGYEELIENLYGSKVPKEAFEEADDEFADAFRDELLPPSDTDTDKNQIRTEVGAR